MFIRICLFLLLPLALFAEDKAYLKYKAGEHATTPEARKAAFNDALQMYLQMESDSPSSKLLFDIANTYYQLHEYGYAILYYHKALKVDPRNSAAESNLQVAEQKVGVAVTSLNFFQKYILFFHYKLSHEEKTTAVLFLLFLAFALLSIHIWVPQVVLKQLSYITLAIALILCASLLWANYFSAPEAIVVRPVALRRDAGEQYAPIVGAPVLVGSKLTVLSEKEDGSWLKVRTQSGEEGYISKEYARII